MDEATYHVWWALHLRVARGESLGDEERKTYEAGRRQLHQAEALDGNVGQLRKWRATVQTLQAEQARLQSRQEQLDAEIIALEAVLDQPTQEKLILKD